jgi:hypothetical protein
LLDDAAVLPAGARFLQVLLKAVTLPTRTAVIFPSCTVFVLFHKGATFFKIYWRGSATVMKALQNILIPLNWC